MERHNLRRAVVAGQFYPSSARQLRAQIEGFADKAPRRKEECLACLLPHAGYVYSGSVAAQTLSRLMVKDRVVMLGPNHTGLGSAFSIMTSGAWETPFGETPIDEELASRILRNCPRLREDALAHAREHSLEVEVPLLQFFNPAVRIVPIAILAGDTRALQETGRGIARAIQEAGLEKEVLVVASSDMTHYEPDASARKKDRAAIEAILRLDEELLAVTIERLGITMCGWQPAVAMISLAKALGARKGELAAYQTSGDVTGDTESVVGYAGILIN